MRNRKVIYVFLLVVQDDVEAQQEFDNFFEEVFTELEDKVTIYVLILLQINSLSHTNDPKQYSP